MPLIFHCNCGVMSCTIGEGGGHRVRMGGGMGGATHAMTTLITSKINRNPATRAKQNGWARVGGRWGGGTRTYGEQDPGAHAQRSSVRAWRALSQSVGRNGGMVLNGNHFRNTRTQCWTDNRSPTATVGEG